MLPMNLGAGNWLILAEPPPPLPDYQNSIYSFCSWSLVTIAAASLIWPLNVPMAALAYKVFLGYAPVPLERGDFMWRSACAPLGLLGCTLIMLGLAFLAIDQGGFPPGLTHLILLMLYLPAGIWFLFWIYALEDMVQATSVFFIFVLLTGIPLLIIGRIAGWWTQLAQVAPWIIP